MTDTDAEIFEWKEPPGSGSTVRSLNSGKLYTREKYGEYWKECGGDGSFLSWDTLLQKERKLITVGNYQRLDKVEQGGLADLPVGTVLVHSDSFWVRNSKRLVKIGAEMWIAILGSDVEYVPESYMTQEYTVLWVPENV